jgi:hypothetical protein
MLLTRQLKYSEFRGFWECINSTDISQEDFKKNILNRYVSSNEGITEKGFIKFFEDTLNTKNGEVNISDLRKSFQIGSSILDMIRNSTL